MLVVCPLCQTSDSKQLYQGERKFYRCHSCQLIFVPPHQLPTREQEKALYDLHENSPDDPRYRAFLNRLAAPLLDRLPAYSQGLDFGSGPGPTLSIMLEEAGHEMEIYDPFYAPAFTFSEKCFDFITMTEVIEHLHQPIAELQRLWRLLRPGGILAIMTQHVPEGNFADWHYIRDPTHVCFYSTDSFQWLSKHFQAELLCPAPNVVFLKKLAL